MTPALTSAVWDSIIPISCFQALELRWANQLIAVVTAEHNLAAHQKVAPVSATEVRSPRVLALYWLWTHTRTAGFIKEWRKTAACVTWLRCHITCAVFAISSVWVDTGAGVGAFCVLTAGVIITVRAQSTLIHICTHIWLKHTQKRTNGLSVKLSTETGFFI